MSDFDNLFDTAISQADDAILDVMGGNVQILNGALAGKTITGVFDNPDSTGYPEAGIRIEGTNPTLFVKSALISGLKHADTLTVNSVNYWVDRVGKDDCGSCHIWLGTGSPPAGTRRR